ncbi:MAG TPA: hypothetical protein VHC96_00835 [Puia sp.]|jgi:hypothetical protein|nr:hypothetical protein [Puia sp.]
MKSAIFLIFLFLSSSVYAQSVERCEILKQICNNEKVQKGLKLDQTDKKPVLVDKEGEFKDCGSIPFGSHVAMVIYDDSLSKKMTKKDPLVLFHDSCNFYIILHLREKSLNYYLFDIIHPYSGLECEGVMRRVNHSYKLVSLHTYVL